MTLNWRSAGRPLLVCRDERQERLCPSDVATRLNDFNGERFGVFGNVPSRANRFSPGLGQRLRTR
jgi:hypothetical protein